MNRKKKSPLNRSVTLSKQEIKDFSARLIRLKEAAELDRIINRTINQDLHEVLDLLPAQFADLLIIDPPYNLYKTFNSTVFKVRPSDEYEKWIGQIIVKLKRTLKQNGSLYFCADWNTSVSVYKILSAHFRVRNRITWEREKGRGSRHNWKNSSEDIWFCTQSDDYKFNADAVKLIRKVLAPYKDHNGEPKDWSHNGRGKIRFTFPSNIWTDISVPFWSMPENTEHPTQKPEKLVAKLILASSNAGDVVLDPFLGSGTTSVVAKKLGRRYVGIEIDKYYACLAEKRLKLAESDNRIQGYDYGFFWERNTMPFPVE